MKTKLLHRTTNNLMEGNPKRKETSLMYLFNESFLKECFRELNKDAAPGIDGITKRDYEKNLDENVRALYCKMKSWKYRPKPSRMVKIPKGKNKFRKLGIPCLEDKMIQIGIKRILDEIFEPLFLDCSYGFRKGRNCHEALRAINQKIMNNPVSYILDADIEDFFGSVNHKLLMKALKVRISDRNFLRLIGRFLKSGIMKDGEYAKSNEGTPQGGLISPILANIYLHYGLDVWFRRKAKGKLKGFSGLIRYADDFVVCFKYESDVKLFQNMLEKRLNSIGLKLSRSKTRILKFGRKPWQDWKNGGTKPGTFDFLGFTHICGTSRWGNFKVEVKTIGKRLISKLSMLNEWFKRKRNTLKLKDLWKILCTKVRGHYEYYGVSGNSRSLGEYGYIVKCISFKWLNRRSQKKSFTWNQFNQFVKLNPLPKPKIKHSLYKKFIS